MIHANRTQANRFAQIGPSKLKEAQTHHQGKAGQSHVNASTSGVMEHRRYVKAAPQGLMTESLDLTHLTAGNHVNSSRTP